MTEFTAVGLGKAPVTLLDQKIEEEAKSVVLESDSVSEQAIKVLGDLVVDTKVSIESEVKEIDPKIKNLSDFLVKVMAHNAVKVKVQEQIQMMGNTSVDGIGAFTKMFSSRTLDPADTIIAFIKTSGAESDADIIKFLETQDDSFYTAFFSSPEKALEFANALASRENKDVVVELIKNLDHLPIKSKDVKGLIKATLHESRFPAYVPSPDLKVNDDWGMTVEVVAKLKEDGRHEHIQRQNVNKAQIREEWANYKGKHLPKQMSVDFKAINVLGSAYKGDVLEKYFNVLDNVIGDDGKTTKAWAGLNKDIKGKNASIIGKIMLLDVYCQNTEHRDNAKFTTEVVDKNVMFAFKGIPGKGVANFDLIRRYKDLDEHCKNNTEKKFCLQLACPLALADDEIKAVVTRCLGKCKADEDGTLKGILTSTIEGKKQAQFEGMEQGAAETFLDEGGGLQTLLSKITLRGRGTDYQTWLGVANKSFSKAAANKKFNQSGIDTKYKEHTVLVYEEFLKMFNAEIIDPKYAAPVLENLKNISSCLALGSPDRRVELFEIEVASEDKLTTLAALKNDVLKDNLPCLEEGGKMGKFTTVFLDSRRPDAVLTFLKRQGENKVEEQKTKTVACLNTFVSNASEGSTDYRYGTKGERPSVHLAKVFESESIPKGDKLEAEWRKGASEELRYKKTKYQLVDTDDPIDQFLMGSEGGLSCLNVDHPPEENKCLLANVVDGKNRLIAVKDKDGMMVGRSIFRILWDEKNNRPALFLEVPYTKTLPEEEQKAITDAIKAMAKKRAATLSEESGVEIKVFEASIGKHPEIALESFGSPAPYEKPDAVKGGDAIVEGGVFTYDHIQLME